MIVNSGWYIVDEDIDVYVVDYAPRWTILYWELPSFSNLMVIL